MSGWLLAAALLLQAQPSAESPRIAIYSPPAGRPAAGETQLWADVVGELDAPLVVFRLDEREVGRFREPPYQLTVDLGPDNREHRFEVVVRGTEGEITRALRITPALHVDEEVDLELRQLYVTVERDGQRVRGLGREAFEVMDDGEAQEVVTFEGGDAPLAAAVLVDASLSMRGEPLRSAVAGARAFVAGMKDLDQASLVLFSDRPMAREVFEAGGGLSGGVKRFDDLDQLPATGGSAINDQLYLALCDLDGRQGRRVVILLSDGVDVHSSLDAADVLWRMQRSQSMVYWIELLEDLDDQGPSGTVSPWRGRDQHGDEYDTLLRLVETSGGRRLRIDDPAQAPEVFAEILRELREQYVVGYYPTTNEDDGSWHDVRVRVRGRGLAARTRSGYVDVP